MFSVILFLPYIFFSISPSLVSFSSALYFFSFPLTPPPLTVFFCFPLHYFLVFPLTPVFAYSLVMPVFPLPFSPLCYSITVLRYFIPFLFPFKIKILIRSKRSQSTLLTFPTYVLVLVLFLGGTYPVFELFLCFICLFVPFLSFPFLCLFPLVFISWFLRNPLFHTYTYLQYQHLTSGVRY